MAIPTPPAGDLLVAAPGMTGNMRFVGIFNIVYGALTCLSIIGALVGIPMIIMGVRLREAADAYDDYRRSNGVAVLQHALERQHRYFFIMKVLAIISIVVLALYLIGLMVFGMFATLSSR